MTGKIHTYRQKCVKYPGKLSKYFNEKSAHVIFQSGETLENEPVE